MVLAGLALWAVLIPLPMGLLCWDISVPDDPIVTQQVADIRVLAPQSIGLAAAVAAMAVCLGWAPARILASTRKGAVVLWLVVLMGMLLPRYVIYYAWSLLLVPTHPLGRWLSSRPAWAMAIGSVTSIATLVLWYWPLAALLISQGFRSMDRHAWESAQLDAGRLRRFTSVVLPLMARSIVLAFGACFALALAEFATFHLAGVRTVGTELATLYELTGSAGAVLRAAWPLLIPAVIVAVALWTRSAQWQINAPHEQPCPPPQRRHWIGMGAVVLLSPVVPLALLVWNLSDLTPFRTFVDLHRDELFWSLLVSMVAAAGGLLIAAATLELGRFGRAGRWASGAVGSTIFAAMLLPGSVVAVALLRALGAAKAPLFLRAGWMTVSAGQAARFAGVTLILMKLAGDTRHRHLSEMAAVDGASRLSAWRWVHLPRTWPMLAGAMILATALGTTELSATMILLPAGLPSFAQRLLNQMHYARDQHVITYCLILAGAYLAMAAVVVGLLSLVRRRLAMMALLLCIVPAICAGCSCDAASSDRPVKVLGDFGRTGRGAGEFLYPRAIARAGDGTLFVIDKTARIQRFDAKGRLMGSFAMPAIKAGKPTGLTVGPDGNIYVADTHYHCIAVFSPEGKLLRRFGKMGQEDGCFIYPTDVAFAPDGRIFVSEYGGNDRVSIFSPAGEFLSSFGSFGSGPGELSRPSALCVDAKRNRLYVADACNHRIAVYDLQGRLIRYIASAGLEVGELRYPYDLALTADGDLVVCEYGNNRLQVFAPDGASRGVFGGAGRALGQLAYPWGVVVDAKRRAYVVDAGNNRVQIWQL